MSIHQGHSRNPNPNPFQGEGAGAFLAVAGVIGAVLALFSASVAAAIASLVYVALAGSLLFGLVRVRGARPRPALLLLIASGAAALLGPIAVFDWRWFDYTALEIAVAGLYVASLVFGLFASLNGFWRWLAAALALALVAAIVYVPVPKGGEGEDEGFTVEASVRDGEGLPVPGALVKCAIAFIWQDGLQVGFDDARTTGLDGRSGPWEFHEDPRLKAVLCAAMKAADSGNAGYPKASAILVPILLGENEVELEMHENPHPGTAYLGIELGSPPDVNWYYLNYELWPYPPGDASFGESPGGGRGPIATASYAESGKKDFTIQADDAAADLYLRYRYEGPQDSGEGPPKVVYRTLHIGSIEPGTRRTVTLDIPWKTQE